MISYRGPRTPRQKSRSKSCRKRKREEIVVQMSKSELREYLDMLKREKSKNKKPQIIHFESPPRRRLREREDEVLKDFHEEIQREENRVLTPREKLKRANDTVERLMMCDKERKHRLGILKHKLNKEIESKLKDRPTISEYKLKRPYIPPHLRSPEQQEPKEKSPYMTERELEDMRECTFSPRIRKNKYNSDLQSSVDSLIKWGEERNVRNLRNSLRAMLPDEKGPSFSPEILEKSKIMAKRKRSGDNRTTEDRLIDYGSEKPKRMKKLKKKLNEGLFKPKINSDSIRMIEKKRQGDENFEKLCKVANGKTVNLDFFTAIPKSAIDKDRETALYFKEKPDLSESIIKLNKCEREKSRSRSPFSNLYNAPDEKKRRTRSKRKKKGSKRDTTPLIKSFLLSEIEKSRKKMQTPIIKGILKDRTPSTRHTKNRGRSSKSIRFKGLEGDVSEFWLKNEEKLEFKNSKQNVRGLIYKDVVAYDKYGNQFTR